MTFHIITIFPEAIKSYFDSSILKRAQEKKLIKIKFYNPRDFTKDKHRKVDDIPFGGGPGMVFKLEPLIRIIDSILKKRKNAKIFVLSPTGKQFTQILAKNLSKKNKDVVLVCGRYEGIDARIKKIFKITELSVGPYILSGGELPAGIIVDAVSRHIPGVLGSQESLEDERGVGIPVYTRPEIFEYNTTSALVEPKCKKYCVPKILLSGNHKKIQEWREKHKSARG